MNCSYINFKIGIILNCNIKWGFVYDVGEKLKIYILFRFFYYCVEIISNEIR